MKDMKFIIWLIVLISTIVIVDIVLGVAFNWYVRNHSLPGDYESIETIIKHNDNDLLVLGSSVALNSINTQTLEDSLGLVSFNAGGNGQAFPYFLTILKAAINKKVPKVVILCLEPNTLAGNGVGPRYRVLVPYYGMGISDIDENLNNLKEHNEYFLKSTSYKLNSVWLRILLYHFITPDIKGTKGHIAKSLPPQFPVKNDVPNEPFTEEREQQLIEFFEICKEHNIKLYIFITPHFQNYKDINNPEFPVWNLTRLAKQYNVPLYNDNDLEPFASSAELFYDDRHINLNGTKMYTDTVITRIKKQLNVTN